VFGGSTDFPRAQSLTEMFLNVSFEAVTANWESFPDSMANMVIGFFVQGMSDQRLISSCASWPRSA